MKTRGLRLFQAALLFLGLLFIAFGIYRGEAQVVLDKAVRICMECIGIG